MARKVVDTFNTNGTSGKLFYLPGDIPNTGTTAQCKLVEYTYREALDFLKSIAPSNVYWNVDATGRVSFKPSSTSPDHTFTFGRHVSAMRVERSVEKVRNLLLIDSTTAATYKLYTDTPSLLKYGRRLERVHDYGLVDADSVDAFAAKFFSENKDASIKLVATILDNNAGDDTGYDIESVEPGQTCRFVGFSSTMSDIFKDNMLITAVRYTLDKIQIEVELVKSGLLDIQAKQGQQINTINKPGLSDSYS